MWEIIRFGQLRDARLKRTFNRISGKIISTRPPLSFEQNLRVPKVLLGELLKQVAI
jgi:hypothetical protein